MTVNGCKCKSPCTAHLTDFKCEKCDVEGECGYKKTFGGYYDFCALPGNNTFEEQTYTEKMDYFMERLQAKCGEDYKILEGFALEARTMARKLKIISQSVAMTFDNQNDELPS